MTDTDKTLSCPACGCEMTKIFINEKGINVDVCSNNCGGIFFDCKELQQCSYGNEGILEIKQQKRDKNFMPVDESQTRICPSCGTPMVKTKSFGIQIDTCYNCGGVFLDNNEFEKIQEHISKGKNKPKPQINQTQNIDLHKFCKDAIDEENRIKSFSKIVDILTRNCTVNHRFFR